MIDVWTHLSYTDRAKHERQNLDIHPSALWAYQQLCWKRVFHAHHVLKTSGFTRGSIQNASLLHWPSLCIDIWVVCCPGRCGACPWIVELDLVIHWNSEKMSLMSMFEPLLARVCKWMCDPLESEVQVPRKKTVNLQESHLHSHQFQFTDPYRWSNSISPNITVVQYLVAKLMFPILSNFQSRSETIPSIWSNQVQPPAPPLPTLLGSFDANPMPGWGHGDGRKVDKQMSWEKIWKMGQHLIPWKQGGIGDLMIASFKLHLMTLQMSDDGCGGCFWYILCSISISPLRMLFDEAISQTRGQTSLSRTVEAARESTRSFWRENPEGYEDHEDQDHCGPDEGFHSLWGGLQLDLTCYHRVLGIFLQPRLVVNTMSPVVLPLIQSMYLKMEDVPKFLPLWEPSGIEHADFIVCFHHPVA